MTHPTKQTKRPSLGDELDQRVLAAYGHHDPAPFPDLPGLGAPARRAPRRIAVLAVAAAVTAVVAAPIALSQLSTSGTEGGQELQAGPTPQTDTPSTTNSVDASVIRGDAANEGGRLSDYVSVPTLTDEVDRYQVGVSGRILSWSEGRTVRDGNIAFRYATLAIEVEHATKVIDESQREVAYFSVPRGAEIQPADGEPLTPEYSAPTVEEFQNAVPVGTRIIAIGYPTGSVEEQQYGPSVQIESPDAGVPAGGTLAGPAFQGFLVETSQGGFDTMLAPIEDLASWASHAANLAGNNASTPDSPGSFQNLVAELTTVVD